jgi:hypothetical protein
MLRSLTAVMALSIVGGACAAPDVQDELAVDSPDGAGDGKADGAADGAYTYFEIKADLRKCLAPVCGGFFLDRLNRTTTVCVNGSSSASCYVPALDWSEAGLSAGLQSKLVDATNNLAGGTRAIVRGRFASKTYPGHGNLGRFVVTEAWVAESDTVAEGVFAKLVPSGIVCITAPCPSLKEKGLNGSNSANIAEVDWSYANLTDKQIEGFTTEMFSDHGTIIAGSRYYDGHAKGRTATAAYHRLVDLVTGP